MAHASVFLLLANLAVSAPTLPRPVFAFASDSLQATLTRIGGPMAPREPGGDAAVPADTPAVPPEGASAQAGGAPGAWRIACDSAMGGAPAGADAWFEVDLIDTRAGTDLRFPVDAAALRKGLKRVCAEEGNDPALIAAGLRALAARLRVRMGAPEAEADR